MMTDYHVHPHYSKDASGSPEEYCERALAIGLDEICFTPHLDLDPERAEIDDWVKIKGEVVSMRSDWLNHYLEEVAALREIYEGRGLGLKAGIEVDYAPEIEGELRGVLSAHPFDYILGAIHCLDHIAISAKAECEQYFRGKSLGQVLTNYFTVMSKAVSSGLFDAIAHFDGYRKYGVRHVGDAILSPERALVGPVLTLMARKGVGLELNTSEFRHGQDEPYPGKEILSWAKDAGVQVLTCGSDSHRVEHLGECLEEGYSILKELGFTPPFTFSRRG